MTPEQRKAALKLKAQARLRLQTNSGPSVGSGEQGVWGAAMQGFDSAGRSIGGGIQGIGEVTGIDAVTDYGKSMVDENNADIKRRGYKRDENYDGIIKNIGEGDFGDALGSLGYAALESAPSIATGVVASAAAAAAATVGSVPAAVVAGGATVLGAIQSIGDIKQEAKEKGIDSTTGLGDVATGVGSAALELLPFGKGGKVGLGIVKEGLQEAGQEALVIGNTAASGGEYTASEAALRIGDAGIVGGVVSKGMDAAGGVAADVGRKVGESVGSVFKRTDDGTYTSDDAELAQLLKDLTDNNPEKLGNVSTTESGIGAQSVAKAALKTLRAEQIAIVGRMKSLAKVRKQEEAITSLSKVVAEGGLATAANTDFSLSKLDNAFAGEPDLDRLKSVHRMLSHVQAFAQGSNDLGGISGTMTRYMDPTDGRNSGITKGVSILGNSGTLGAGIAVNRAARVIDKLTNRRSRIKRYVDSVDKSGVKVNPIGGPTSTDTLNTLTEMAREAVRSEGLKKQAEVQIQKAKKASEAALQQKMVVDQREALAEDKARTEAGEQAMLFKQNALITSEMFMTGVVPQSTEDFKTFEPYEAWETQTGMTPEDTTDVLEQLEREGLAPKGSAQKYSETIRDFPSDQSTYNLQRLVQQRGNPGYVPKAKPKPVPDAILIRLAASTVKPTTSRGQYKAKEGSRRSQNVMAAIEAGRSSLRPKVYQALVALKDAIDRPDMNKTDREMLIQGTIPKLFNTAGQRAHWMSEFMPLASIGNDERIFKKVPTETEEEAEFDTKVEKARNKKPKKEKKTADEVKEPEPQKLLPYFAEKKADEAVAKLNGETRAVAEANVSEPDEVMSDVDKAIAATEPTPKPSVTGKTGLEKSVDDRIQQFEDIINTASEEGPELVAYVNELMKSKSTASRVEQMIYAFANDRLTANMLIDAYGDKYDIPYDAAAKLVLDVITDWADQGHVKVFQGTGASKLIVGGEYIKDEDGNSLDVMQIELLNEGMKNALNIAKAVRSEERMINPNEPDFQYSTSLLQDGANQALKDYDASQIDETFTPFLNFLNDLRSLKFTIHEGMLDQIEEGIATGGKKKGMIARVLRPRKHGKPDNSPLNTAAQLLWQLGRKAERTTTQFRMEWSAGRNLRVYSKNGLAHSQAGDMMKGMMRTGEKGKLGDVKALKFMFHAFGNLLGNDKKSPEVRRGTIFQEGRIEALMDFAKDPFGQYVLQSSKGNVKPIASILKDGEGFFQVLNVAHEVTSMVNFAKKRNPDKALWPVDKLLQNEKVQADLAANYETDFIVQLDASNNAYQIVGLTTGYAGVLKATGLMPRDNSDPDTQAGADIYMATALAVVDRIPELKALKLPASVVRKIFKKPISTYVYAAALQSRKAAFDAAFDEYLNGDSDGGEARVVGTGEIPGLIQVPDQVVAAMKSDQGFIFRDEKLENGASKKVFSAKKIIESDPPPLKAIKLKPGKEDKRELAGRFQVAVRSSANGKFGKGGKRFKTADEAIAYTFEQDLYGRMSAELIQDFEARYPQVKEYMDFFASVSKLIKDRGESVIKVPTPDGMVLEYSFKEKDSYEAVPYDMGDGRVVNIGVKTPDSKITGRGLSAFATHQLDAYVLRETYKRMKQQGSAGFNPIHDSFGFHPSEAALGQETTLQVMQELGSKEYNLFMNVLLENNLLKAFQESGGVMPKREGITPYAAKDIPTAMS